MKKKLVVTQKQLSEILQVSPQAVGEATQRGNLFRDSGGLYDLNHTENREYIKEKGIVLSKIKIPQPGNAGRPIGKKPQGEIKTISNIDSNIDLRRKNLILKNQKLALEIDAKNKILLPADFIQKFVFKYIERLNANIERIASVGIQDIGNDILEAGEVLPAHIQTFTNLILEATHNTKKGILKEIEKYEPAAK